MKRRKLEDLAQISPLNGISNSSKSERMQGGSEAAEEKTATD